MSKLKITKIEVHEFTFEMSDVGKDYNGFNLVYKKGSNQKVELLNRNDISEVKIQYDKSDKLLLDNFFEVINNNQLPICDAEDALNSILVLEACRKSFETNQVVTLEK